MAPRIPKMPKITLPSGETITQGEFEKFEKTLQSVKGRAEDWNRYINSLPSYFDKFNAQRPFSESEFGAYRYARTANANDLIGLSGYGTSGSGRYGRTIESRQQFLELQAELDRANSDNYIESKIEQYIQNYMEALKSTYDLSEISEILDALSEISAREFVALANLHDLSIKYTVSGDNFNPYTGASEAQLQLDRLREAFGIGT